VSRSVQVEKSTPFYSISPVLWKLIALVDSATFSEGQLVLPKTVEEEKPDRPSSMTLQGAIPREWLDGPPIVVETWKDRSSTTASRRRSEDHSTAPISSIRRRSDDQTLPPLPGRRRSAFQTHVEMAEEYIAPKEAPVPEVPGPRSPSFNEIDEVEEGKRKSRRASFSAKMAKSSENITQRSRPSLTGHEGMLPKTGKLSQALLAVTPSTIIFESSASHSIKKLGLSEKYVEILTFLKKPTFEDKEKADTDVAARYRAKEIAEIIIACIEKLSARNKLSLILTELQWTDIYSLEIFYQIASSCPRIAIFLFCRPEWTYDSEETKGLIDLMQQTARFKHIVLQGFSQEDTAQMVLDIWANPSITTVNPKISESILNRTGGNPFFIKSLAIAMKESGQWRISPVGELLTQSGTLDGESLNLGYDNQGIILGRFDRIDRNLQLFLKVAAVMGIKWALDDVLYFVTGIQNLSSKVDNKSYNAIIKGVITSDRYGFIQLTPSLLETGACFSFKSPVIRKCIYSLMAQKQRQQVHLYAAQYYESKLNEYNKPRFLTQILEHYMETDDNQLDQKLLYVRLVAKFHYDAGSAAEAVTYYRIFLQMMEEHKEAREAESDFTIANWYREYGNSLYCRGEMYEACQALVKSLQILGAYLPETRIKLWWALRTQNNLRKKHDAEFLKSNFFKEEPLDYSAELLSNPKKNVDNMNLGIFNVKTNPPQERPSIKLGRRGSFRYIKVNLA
jgi:hypothetical protein